MLTLPGTAPIHTGLSGVLLALVFWLASAPPAEAQSSGTSLTDEVDQGDLAEVDKCLTSDKTRIDFEAYAGNRPEDFYTTCISKSEVCPAVLTRINDYEPEMYHEYPPIFVYADVPGSMAPSLVGSKGGSEVYAADVDVFNTGEPERVYWVLWSLGVKYPALMVGINPDAEEPPVKFTGRKLRAGEGLFPKDLGKFVWRRESGIRWVGTTLIELDNRTYLAAASPVNSDQPALVTIFEMASVDSGKMLCQFTSDYSLQAE